MATRLLKAKEVAERLGIHRSSAYRRMKQMPHVVLGDRMLRVSETVLEDYIRARTVSPDGCRPSKPRPRRAARPAAAMTPERNAEPGPPRRLLRVVYPRTKPRQPAGRQRG